MSRYHQRIWICCASNRTRQMIAFSSHVSCWNMCARLNVMSPSTVFIKDLGISFIVYSVKRKKKSFQVSISSLVEKRCMIPSIGEEKTKNPSQNQLIFKRYFFNSTGLEKSWPTMIAIVSSFSIWCNCEWIFEFRNCDYSHRFNCWTIWRSAVYHVLISIFSRLECDHWMVQIIETSDWD